MYSDAILMFQIEKRKAFSRMYLNKPRSIKFKNKFYFQNNFKLTKSCKNNTADSYISLTQIPNF